MSWTDRPPTCGPECPDSATLLAFLREALQPEDSDRTRQAIETCAGCRENLEDLRSELALGLELREARRALPPLKRAEVIVHARNALVRGRSSREGHVEA